MDEGIAPPPLKTFGGATTITGVITAILIGIVAAFIGTAIARAIGIPTVTNGIDRLELLVQVIVAALGVALVSALMGRRRTGLLGSRRSGLLR
ncbi:GlsB/YeaQ/YmgE family stress response membrane protein [Mycolicibacterium moriokaense]|uniref:GlsB/YeaQ/YmgE family stress response membrane protein n=1 Tax=Mycolicibacterium moriokaense TaxID=39691 RepID=UPI003C6E3F92